MPSESSPLTETGNLGAEAAELAEDALGHAMSSAEGSAEGFPPFAMVLHGDGRRDMTRFIAGPDLEVARASAAATESTAIGVALAWDGYLTLDGERSEAVFVEAYELGRPAGVLIAQPYERQEDTLIRAGAPVICAEPEPLVPLTVELARRHAEEFGDGGRRSLRWLVEQAGGDMDAFDAQPTSCRPLIDEVADELRSGDLSDDDRVYLHTQLAAYIAEVLLRTHGGRWDVVADDDRIAHVVAVGDRHLDPFRLVNDQAKELKSASQMLDQALSTVGL